MPSDSCRSVVLIVFVLSSLIFSTAFCALAVELRDFHAACTDTIRTATYVFGSLAGYYLLIGLIGAVFGCIQRLTHSKTPNASGYITITSSAAIVFSVLAGLICLYDLVYRSHLSCYPTDSSLRLSFKESLYIVMAILVVAIIANSAFLFAGVNSSFKNKNRIIEHSDFSTNDRISPPLKY